MNVRVLAMSDKLDVIGVYATAVETGMVQLPTMTPIGTRRRGDRSVHRFPSNPVCVIRPAAAFNADGRIPALAGMTALPLTATGDDVDNELALHTLQGRRRATFDWHSVFLKPARRPARLGASGALEGGKEGRRRRKASRPILCCTLNGQYLREVLAEWRALL